MLSTLLSDIRSAIRSALRQPGFAVVVVGTLALGIGANTAMFALIHAALLKPLPYEEPDRLVLARRTVAGSTRMWNSAPDYYDYREQTSGFKTLAAAGSGSFLTTVTGGVRPERVATAVVTYDLLPMLGVAPIAGRSFTSDEGKAGAPYVAMVSERLAERRFGGAQPAVGQALAITGVARTAVSATIVGVLPATYRFLDEAEMWVPMRRGERDGPQTRMFHNWVLVGRLKAGMSIDAVQGQVDVIARRLQQQYPATNKEKGLRLDPLQGALLQSQTPMLMVLKQALAWVGVGSAIGLAASLALGRLVSALLFGLDPIDPATIAASSATLAVAAAFWPARRAARLNPLTALRCE
jgi:putative ABC transport system permease protein